MTAIFYALWSGYGAQRALQGVLMNERQLRDVGLDQDFVRSRSARLPFWHE